MIEYPPGTPCWVELRSPDPDASAAFYGELLGWAARGRVFTLEGDEVAGIEPLPPEPGPRPAWITHIAGGTTEPELRADAEGAVFAVSRRAAQRVNEPGALTMNELRTRSIEAASRFYGDAFGWTVEPIEQGGTTVYASARLDGRLVAGMLPMGDAFPPVVPAHWVPYFGVEDLEEATARARELGGQVVAGPIDVPGGRFVALADPHGAAFAIWNGSYDDPPG